MERRICEIQIEATKFKYGKYSNPSSIENIIHDMCLLGSWLFWDPSLFFVKLVGADDLAKLGHTVDNCFLLFKRLSNSILKIKRRILRCSNVS